MKQLKSSLQKALNSQTPKYIKKVLLFTRSWDEENKIYSFNDSIDISAYILDMSPIKWKMDNEGYAIWNSAATTITLSNYAGYFNEDNPSGILTGNKLLYGSRVEIFGGAEAEGEKEYLKVFRSFVLNTPIHDDKEKTLILSLSGELALLKNFSAEDISILSFKELLNVTGEDLSLLHTSQTAVGKIIDVYKGKNNMGADSARLLKPESDYKISNLNSAKEPASIKLTRPLLEGESCWATYRHWHKDKSLDWIAAEVAALTGNTETEIHPMVFENINESGIENNFTQPENNSFEEGSFEYTALEQTGVRLANNFPEPFKGDWEVISIAPNTYFQKLQGDDIWLATYSGYNFNGQAVLARPANHAYGTWEATVETVNGQNHRTWFHIVASTNAVATTQGYVCCQFQYDSRYLFFSLYRMENNMTTIIGERYGMFDKTFTEAKYRIMRDNDGTFHAWVTVTKPLSPYWHYLGVIAVDNTYTVSNYQMVVMQISTPNRLKDLKSSPLKTIGTGDYAPTGSYLSPVIDGGDALETWQEFKYEGECEENTSFFTKYRSRNEEQTPWSEWRDIASETSPDTHDRYLQLKWEAYADPPQYKSPTLKNWSLSSISRGIVISIVNTGGISCYDIMRELAQMTGYQIGYDTEGKFLFKPRNNGGPQLTLTNNDIIEIESINNNVEKLYNRLTVNFGLYSRTVDAFTKQEARPNLIDKYGVKELSVSSGNLLPGQNANIACAIAPEIYNKVSHVKKQLVVITKFLPHIELDDIINIDYPPLLQLTTRVEGLEINLTDWTMRLDLTEI